MMMLENMVELNLSITAIHFKAKLDHNNKNTINPVVFMDNNNGIINKEDKKLITLLETRMEMNTIDIPMAVNNKDNNKKKAID